MSAPTDELLREFKAFKRRCRTLRYLKKSGEPIYFYHRDHQGWLLRTDDNVAIRGLPGTDRGGLCGVTVRPVLAS